MMLSVRSLWLIVVVSMRRMLILSGLLVIWCLMVWLSLISCVMSWCCVCVMLFVVIVCLVSVVVGCCWFRVVR